MSRHVAVGVAAIVFVLAIAGTVRADDGAGSGSGSDDGLGDQAIDGELGVAVGGHVTPGGLRIAGHYLYQLTDADWFDGIAAFTYGGGGAACFDDRGGHLQCTHGTLQGDEVELVADVRHYFPARGTFRPFGRAGLGAGVVHFSGDSLTGAALTLHAGGGVRAQVADGVAIVASAELEAGVGDFGRGLGAAPQLGGAILAGAELRLR